MFKIGDKLTKENYPQGAIWCNKNGAMIDQDTWEIKAIPAPSPEDSALQEINELKQKLAETDYCVIKIAEEVAEPSEYSDVLAQRKTWRARINELEAIIGALNAE